MTTPDWLAVRDGGLTTGLADNVLLVTFDGTPQYRLDALPARGTFTCAVVQTNNGRRVDGGKQYPSREAALSGGLEELRSSLGW